MTEIKISIKQLEYLLDQQKQLVVDRVLQSTSYWNPDSTDAIAKPLNIDKEKFTSFACEASYPKDIEVLKRYLP